jgi:phage gpG-like protein
LESNLNTIQIRFKQVMVTLPVKVGATMLEFTRERFKEQGWRDISVKPWKARKSTAKRNTGRAILMDKGRLARATRVTRITANSVTIGNDTPYAKVHNEGIDADITVAAHTRKAHKRMKGTGVFRVKTQKEIKTKQAIGESNVQEHTRRMKIDKRQFMGKSAYLDKQIEKLMEAEIMKVFK